MSSNSGLAQVALNSVLKTRMVAERVSQGHAPAHHCFFPTPRARPRIMDGPYTPNFPDALRAMQERGHEADQAMMILALVSVAHALVPLARRVVEATIRRMAGSANVDFEDVLARVDWESPQQLVSPRNLQDDFEDIQVTPTSPRTMATINDGHVARMAQRFDVVQTNNEQTQQTRQTTETQQDCDNLTTAKLAIVIPILYHSSW